MLNFLSSLNHIETLVISICATAIIVFGLTRKITYKKGKVLVEINNIKG